MIDELNTLIAAKLKNIDFGNTIAVAVSGGIDSLALTFILSKCCKARNIKLIAITIDHNLRVESAEEAELVSNILKKNNILHKIIKWNDNKPNSNIQAKAREARYRLLIDYCKSEQIRDLFIAHNKEDVAETFLINLHRGSGLDGLAAMKKVSYQDGIKIIRPLLEVSRKDLKSYLIEMKIKWINDPSNENNKFKRIKIRKELENDRILKERIVLAASHLRSVKNYVDKKIIDSLNKVSEITEYGFAKIKLKEFIKLEEYELITILTYILQMIGGNSYKPRFNSLTALIEQIKIRKFKSATLLGCKIVIRKNEDLLIYREDNKVEKCIVNDTSIYWDNRFRVTIPELLLTEKLMIESLGSKNWQTLEKKDIFLENNIKNIPKAIFYSLPVVKDLEKILYIPYINYGADSKYGKIKFKFDPLKLT